MDLLKWAEAEVKRAVDTVKSIGLGEDTAVEDGEYAKACYLSALSAFKCLANQGHSGMSIQATKVILNSLIDGKPLTPIEDEDEVWNLATAYGFGKKLYQCSRMSSLFKTVDANGNVSFSDNNRVVGASISNPNVFYHSKLVSDIVNEMYPISMPYTPARKPYVVKCQDILHDPNNGDFDTVRVLELTTPSNEVVKIDRYFKESDDGWAEIDEHEWKERLAVHQQRLEKLKSEQRSEEQIEDKATGNL